MSLLPPGASQVCNALCLTVQLFPNLCAPWGQRWWLSHLHLLVPRIVGAKRSIALLITQDKKISERFPSLPISEPLLVPMSEDGIYS